MANVLRNLDRFGQAEKLARATLAARHRIHGHDHYRVIEDSLNLMEILFFQGKYDETLALHADVFPRCKRVLGPNHQTTLYLGYVLQAVYAHKRG